MGLKLHTPTFHKGGNKYRLSSFAKLKTSRRGSIGLSWRSGWREHDKSDDAKASALPRLKSVGALVKPQTSARSLAVTGRYKNPLRSTVYG